MTADIISLGDMSEQDENYQESLKDLTEDVTNAIFWVEKTNGSIKVGCNYDDRRDLVFALYRVQNLIHQILQHEGQ